MLRNRGDARVSILIANHTELGKLRLQRQDQVQTGRQDGWTGGPGDEHENGQVAVQGGHMDSGNRAELKSQDSYLFSALWSLDTISG